MPTAFMSSHPAYRPAGESASPIGDKLLPSFLFASLAVSIYCSNAASAAPMVTASELEAVSDSNGDPAYSNSSLGPNTPVLYEGIVLNAPSAMLSTAAQAPSTAPFDLGGQWQTFVQTTTPGDYDGVALYEAQNYGNIPDTGFDSSLNYTPAQFNAQVTRLDHYAQNAPGTLPSAGYQLQAGDLVEVVVRGALFFEGKMNINEEHTPTFDYSTDPQHSFDVIYLGHPGLPAPIPLALGQIEDVHSNPNFSTDTTLPSNPEHYQGSLVSLTNVELVPGQQANWVAGAGTNGLAPVTVEDSSGREFTVWLGTSPLFTPANAPTGFFNLTGIFDQETQPQGPYSVGYSLYVVTPTAVPEPSACVLLALAMTGFVGWKLRKRRMG